MQIKGAIHTSVINVLKMYNSLKSMFRYNTLSPAGKQLVFLSDEHSEVFVLIRNYITHKPSYLKAKEGLQS